MKVAIIAIVLTVFMAPRVGRADWGVETEVVQPFIPEVRILSARGTRTVWGDAVGLRGDVMVGVFARPGIAHDIVETMNEYLVAIGYRQTFVLGLHAEATLLGGWALGESNLIDGEDYSNPSILLEALLGYRFGFFEKGGFFHDGSNDVGFYVSPQFGFIAGLSTDIGPRGGKSDFFIQGKLVLGVSF